MPPREAPDARVWGLCDGSFCALAPSPAFLPRACQVQGLSPVGPQEILIVSKNQRLRLPTAGLWVPVLPRFVALSLNHSPGHVLGPLLLSSLWVLSHTVGLAPAHPSRFGEPLPETHGEVGVDRRSVGREAGPRAGWTCGAHCPGCPLLSINSISMLRGVPSNSLIYAAAVLLTN